MIVGLSVLWTAAFRHTTAFCSLPRFPVLIVGMGTASSVAPLLSFIFNTSACCSFSFMRVVDPSCLHRCLKCSGWDLSFRPLRYCYLWLTCSKTTAFPVAAGPYSNISLDFITGLPRNQNKNDSIMVVVDKLSKETHFIPVKTTYKDANIDDIFLK